MAKNIRIDHIDIANYKGIDKLSLSFPLGKMPADHDVNILGSKNGIGKTSVLECCALILLAASTSQDIFDIFSEGEHIAYSDIIRSGAKNASISGKINVDDKEFETKLTISSSGRIKSSGAIKPFVEQKGNNISSDILNRILGMFPDPVVGKCFFLLHSYRKVQEGKPELGMMIDDDFSTMDRRMMRYRIMDRESISFSLFKRIIVRHLMEEANLFEPSLFTDRRDENILAPKVLNDLLETYANVRIGKLRPYRDNTIDVQVEKIDQPNQSFSIDGLSSGQKEIISTLFMIWNATYNKPNVVLIDEPELHLNVQWHSGFVQKLIEIAPNNQYILATHAEAIMGSVRKENRILLVNDI